MDLLYTIYSHICIILDQLIDFVFGLYFKKCRKYLPPIKNNLVLESASSLVKKIKNKEVKAEDVVEAFIDRIKEVNPYLNALVDERFMDALKEARKIDEDIRNGKLKKEDFENKPLLGIPFTAKESTASKGLKWTLGLLVRKNVLAEEDATVIKLMKKAGAIHIGITNVPQLNFWPESYNPIYGICCNPYDTTKNAGGSSGGEGSIIAACGSPIGIGTDIGGSIRIPSHRCGIFGHKPSPNLISTKGLSFSNGEIPQLSVVGPMAKRAEDLLPILKILVDENYEKLKLDDDVNFTRLNIFYNADGIKCFWTAPIEEQMKDNVLKVVNYFEDISGKKAMQVSFDEMRHAMKLWSYKMRLENIDFNSNLTNRQGRVNVPLEYLKYIFRMSEYNFYTLFNMINGLLPSVDYQWAQETLEKLKADILALLGDNGVLIFPSDSGPAKCHYTTILRPGISYFCIWNALELPVTQVPLGLNSNGLPTGVQIVAAPNQDHLSIAVARELEKAFGGYVPPHSI